MSDTVERIDLDGLNGIAVNTSNGLDELATKIIERIASSPNLENVSVDTVQLLIIAAMHKWILRTQSGDRIEQHLQAMRIAHEPK